VKLFREDNIKNIIKAIEIDEYECGYQQSLDEDNEFLETFKKFYFDFKAENLNDASLDLGCGDNDYPSKWGITHAIEPSLQRYELAHKLNLETSVSFAVAEYIPDDFPAEFDNIIAIAMLTQVRSLYEVLIEVNQHLRQNGRFLFSVDTNDETDKVVGVVYGPKNLIRVLTLFGFELVAHYQPTVYKGSLRACEKLSFICVEKIREFESKYLNQPQVIDTEKLDENGQLLYRLANFDLSGRESKFS
jgi:SAM-dependent methyltransferase